jgi:DNA-binding FadR family transcriptional regulator
VLLKRIVSGRLVPGKRLPSERALAEELEVSRPALREAMRELVALNVVSVRHGSGIVAQPPQKWRFEVLPIYLELGAPLDDDGLLGLVPVLLELRRELVHMVFRMAAPSLAPGSLNGARAATTRAWEARDDFGEFIARDLDVYRAIAEAAGQWPVLWLLNTSEGVYVEAARSLGSVYQLPDFYPSLQMDILALLERGDAEGACAMFQTYSEQQDPLFSKVPRRVMRRSR